MLQFIIGLILLNNPAQAAPQIPGMGSKCINAANMAAMDLSMLGVDPDGVSLYFDENGATNVLRPENIVSRSNKDGVETIVYKARQMKVDGNASGREIEFETVNRTLTIKREGGKIVSVKKDTDLKSQVELQKLFAKSGYKMPITKGYEMSFSHNGADCEVSQSLIYEMENEKAKAEAKVNYDRTFCKKLDPIIKQIGSQNASQCVGLIGQAQMAFEQRAQELGREGKKFKVQDWNVGNRGGNQMDIAMMITSCTMMDGFGMGGYGMPGYGMPGGYGGYPGYPMSGGFGEKTSAPGNPASGVKSKVSSGTR